MRNLFNAYRFLAIIVGVLLTVLVFVAVPLKYLAPAGSWSDLGSQLTSIVGVVHGWFYIAYLAVAFFLSRRCRWRGPFTVLTLLAGLVPVLIFFVEAAVTRKVRREFPEVLAVPAAQG